MPTPATHLSPPLSFQARLTNEPLKSNCARHHDVAINNILLTHTLSSLHKENYPFYKKRVAQRLVEQAKLLAAAAGDNYGCHMDQELQAAVCRQCNGDSRNPCPGTFDTQPDPAHCLPAPAVPGRHKDTPCMSTPSMPLHLPAPCI